MDTYVIYSSTRHHLLMVAQSTYVPTNHDSSNILALDNIPSPYDPKLCTLRNEKVQHKRCKKRLKLPLSILGQVVSLNAETTGLSGRASLVCLIQSEATQSAIELLNTS